MMKVFMRGRGMGYGGRGGLLKGKGKAFFC